MRLHYLIVLSCLLRVQGKVFSRCALAKALYDRKDDAMTKKLSSWTCLAEVVSGRNSVVVNTDGNMLESYGMFQIPAQWCTKGVPGGSCNIACEKLTDDNIADDAKCAMTVFYEKGFQYWPKFANGCTNSTVRNIWRDIQQCRELGLIHSLIGIG